MVTKKIIQLCADIGSDTYPYKQAGYEVILIGKDIGVENYNPPQDVYGIIANPVCTEFSTAQGFNKIGDLEKGMFLVKHCQRIILECNPKFWVIENPFNGRLKEFLGNPQFAYQPWQYGSPWTKKTALWGKFNIPKPLYGSWETVPKNNALYVRPTRGKPSLAFLHYNDIKKIPEFAPFIDKVKDDMSFRSLCSQGFANAFYEENK